MVRLVVEFQSEPEVVAAILVFLGGIIAATIAAFATVRAARIQASSHQPPELRPPSKRRGRRPSKRSHSP